MDENKSIIKQKQLLLKRINDLESKIFPETEKDIVELENKYGTTRLSENIPMIDLSDIYKSDVWLNRFNNNEDNATPYAMAARSCKNLGDRKEFENQAIILIQEFESNHDI